MDCESLSDSLETDGSGLLNVTGREEGLDEGFPFVVSFDVSENEVNSVKSVKSTKKSATNVVDRKPFIGRSFIMFYNEKGAKESQNGNTDNLSSSKKYQSRISSG